MPRPFVDAPPPRAGPGSVESLYGFLIESLTEYAVFAVSPDARIISWNAGAARIFGYAQAEIVGRPLRTIFCAEDAAAGEAERELQRALIDRRAIHDRWHVRKDGSRFWGTNTVEPMFDAQGNTLGFTKLVRDTTESHIAHAALADSEERLRLLVDNVPEYGIFSVDATGNITTWNGGAQKTFGYEPGEMIGTSIEGLLDFAGTEPKAPANTLLDAARGGVPTDRWLTRKDGTRFLCSIRATRLDCGSDGELRGYVVITHDITEAYLVTERLQHRAFYDELTHLPNRASFNEHVGRAIALARRHAETLFAVLFIDIDHFKSVNDAIGHLEADRVLAFIARRLESCVRSEDIAARLSGDEFAILLNGISGVNDATDAAARIHAQMAKPIEIGGRTVLASASIGIALGAGDYDTPAAILRDADNAMYTAKARGRARSAVFDSRRNRSDETGRTFSTALRHAASRNELRVEYQPIMRLADRLLVGFEALVRWENPQYGRLLPAQFVLHAEGSDAIIGIDRWVFDQACRRLRQWPQRRGADPPLTMSINISSKQFSQPDFLHFLRSSLERIGIEPARICLEITESAIMERSDRTTELMKTIRSLGVALHADDFGTGYSSLASLQHMPVHALKIDRSFVSGMDARSGSELVSTIVTLAHNLGMDAVAEGIETVAQLDRLTALGCDYGQGFLFAAPLDVARATAFVEDEAGRVAARFALPD